MFRGIRVIIIPNPWWTYLSADPREGVKGSPSESLMSGVLVTR